MYRHHTFYHSTLRTHYELNACADNFTDELNSIVQKNNSHQDLIDISVTNTTNHALSLVQQYDLNWKQIKCLSLQLQMLGPEGLYTLCEILRSIPDEQFKPDSEFRFIINQPYRDSATQEKITDYLSHRKQLGKITAELGSSVFKAVSLLLGALLVGALFESLFGLAVAVLLTSYALKKAYDCFQSYKEKNTLHTKISQFETLINDKQLGAEPSCSDQPPPPYEPQLTTTTLEPCEHFQLQSVTPVGFDPSAPSLRQLGYLR